MESRRFKLRRKEADKILEEKGRTYDISREYIGSFFKKLRQHRVKIETVLNNCELLDSNGDGIIHADDLIDTVDDLLPRKSISRREYHYLIEALGGGKGTQHNIRYMKLDDMYERFKKGDQHEEKETWFEDPYEDEFSGPKGSIGDFLNRAACPAEIQNYKTLIACLERFERETGMRISTNDEGFRVPLGPDLQAHIAFTTNVK